MNWKRALVFIGLLILIILLFNLLFTFIFPLKSSILVSKNMEPAYPRYSILFYGLEANYGINEVILLETNEAPMVTRITAINQDGTYEAKSDNNPAQLTVEKNIPLTKIKGKVIYSVNPLLFYVLLLALEIGIAFLLTKPIYSKLFKK